MTYTDAAIQVLVRSGWNPTQAVKMLSMLNAMNRIIGGTDGHQEVPPEQEDQFQLWFLSKIPEIVKPGFLPKKLKISVNRSRTNELN